MKLTRKNIVIIILLVVSIIAALYIVPRVKDSLTAAAVSSATSTQKHAVTKWTFPFQSAQGSKDEMDGVSSDSNGNIFIGGAFENSGVMFGTMSTSAKNFSDIFVSKLSNNGQILWFKTFDSGGKDFAWDTAVDKNGDVIISGGYGGSFDKVSNGVKTGTFNAWKDGSALWMKLSGKDGHIMWTQVAGVPSTISQLVDPSKVAGGNEISIDVNNNAVVQLTAAGEAYKIGTTTYPKSGSKDSFIVKLNPNGGFMWAFPFLGSGSKQLRAVGITSNNEIVFGHEYRGEIKAGNVTLNSNNGMTAQGTVGMLTAAGAFKWMLPVTSNGFANVRGAGGDSTGNIYITGVLTGADGQIGTTPVKGYANGSTFVAKLAPATKAVLWVRVFGNASPDSAGELTVIAGDKIAITSTNEDANYNLYNADGSVLYAKNIFLATSTATRATLSVLDTTGNLVATHEPTITESSSGGVLSFANNTPSSTCLVYQLSFYGRIAFNNGKSYTSTGAADKDQVLTKICY